MNLQIYVPTNPRGAESLAPGIVVPESDFHQHRLWGNPDEVTILVCALVSYCIYFSSGMPFLLFLPTSTRLWLIPPRNEVMLYTSLHIVSKKELAYACSLSTCEFLCLGAALILSFQSSLSCTAGESCHLLEI